MIRAILDGSKTQTRRVMKPQPTGQLYSVNGGPEWTYPDPRDPDVPDWGRVRHCPYGAIGDRLWVRETWHSLPLEAFERAFSAGKLATISADFKTAVFYAADAETGFPARPSIHMPRWASRITLEIVNVQVQRLQDITEEDAEAEGITAWAAAYCSRRTEDELYARAYFELAWNSINGKRYPWSSNPWVWCITFRRIKP